MMQILSAVITTVAPVSKSSGVENQPNANAEVVQVPHAFQTLLKKQTQSNQQAPQKPAEAEQGVTKSEARQAPQTEVQQARAKQGVAQQASAQGLVGKKREKEESAAKVADEMVALLSPPAEAKPAQVENTVATEPLPENTQAVEQTAAAFIGAMLASNGALNKPASAPPIPQTAGFNLQPQATGATGLPAVSSNATSVVDTLAPHAIAPTPEQTAFATQLNAAKVPMNPQENVTESSSAKPEADKPLNIASAIAGLQNNMQSTTTALVPVASQQVAASNMIEAKFGNTGWSQAISQRVIWMAGAGEQSATLTLNPPDLGALQVVVQVHNGLADTTFTSDNADVRQALQDGMEHLREKMRESGVQLGQTNVQSGEQSQKTFEQATQHRASQHRATASSGADDVATQPKSITRVVNGLVDTFA